MVFGIDLKNRFNGTFDQIQRFFSIAAIEFFEPGRMFVELRDLKTFVVVARLQSFHRASD